MTTFKHGFFWTWILILASPANRIFGEIGWFAVFSDWSGDYSCIVVTLLQFLIFALYIIGARNLLKINFKRFFLFIKRHARIFYRRHAFNLKCLKEDLYYILKKTTLMFKK